MINIRAIQDISGLLIAVSVFFLSACSIPNALQLNPELSSDLPDCEVIAEKKVSPIIDEKKYDLGVVGAVEPVYVLPHNIAMLARIDTGATTSSIDAKNIKLFERDGQNWVSFNIEDRNTKKQHHFEKKLRRKISIKRVSQDENRLVVNMDVLFGKKTITEEFTLADREKFDYQVLIGRNILTGRAVVDTSISNTFY